MVVNAAEVLAVVQARGLAAASIEFVDDPWDHIVEWIARNEQRIAIARGTVTLICRFTSASIDVQFKVGDTEAL